MYDLFVIGAGSGGVRSARLAAAEGFSVGMLKVIPQKDIMVDVNMWMFLKI